MQYSIWTAYVLYFSGGFWGLHHLYLRRPIHAFLTAGTCGGYFFIGLVYDFFKLSSYVKQANDYNQYTKIPTDENGNEKESTSAKVQGKTKPETSWVRHMALMVIGNLFAHLILYAIPSTDTISLFYNELLQIILVPLGSAIGVWLVGNVGQIESPFVPLASASYIISIVSYLLKIPYASFCTLAAIVTNKYVKRVKASKPKPSYLKCITIFFVLMLIYSSIWVSWFYFNCSIKEHDDQDSTIKCSTALNNFIKGPAFQDFMFVIMEIFHEVRTNGFSNLYDKLLSELDLNGRARALKILGLAENVTHQEIQEHYRKLARKYHPDRHKDPKQKVEAHEKFIELQDAYNILKSR